MTTFGPTGDCRRVGIIYYNRQKMFDPPRILGDNAGSIH